MLSKYKGFLYLKSFAKEKKGLYILSIVFATVGVLASILPYYAISQILVLLVEKNSRNFNHFQYWLWIIICAIFVKIIFHNLSTTLSHKATFSVISQIRYKVTEKLVKVPMGYVLSIPSGDLKTSVIDNADSTEPILAHAIPEMTSNILVPIFIVGYIFMLDWRLGIVSLLTFPIGFLCIMGMMKDYDIKFKEMSDVSKHMNSTAIEYINGIEVIKAFSQSASSYEKYKKAVKDNAEYGLSWMKAVQGYFAMGLGIWPAMLIGILPIGCIFYINGSLNISVFITVIILSLGIFGPINAALMFVDDLAKVNTIMEDIGQVVNETEMKRGDSEITFENSNITFENVSFGYDKKKVINNINLEFKEGEVTALVGPSGSGKSTIAKLIASFWDISGGSLKIGNVDVKNIPFMQLNKKIAYVSQDNFLFNESILENIRKGNLNASDKDVVAISKAAGCDEFISKLENGYETIVGSRGGHLSGGERQRITIARAMLKNSDIIILDEATAYTDPENESLIQEAVSKLAKGKTLIVIAHRLSTIVDSDNIYVINEGNVNEKGTFKQLIKNNGLFKSMWKAHESSKDIEEEGLNA